MTIGGWATFLVIAALIIGIGICVFETAKYYSGTNPRNTKTKILRIKILCIMIPAVLSVLLLCGMLWFFQSTAAGQRALTDQKSNLENGLERAITVYTADGRTIAKYSGKIDIRESDGGYMLFDYQGKRYTYYNCFIESIADID